MSRLALISDIHGNGVALDAVFADLARRDVADIVCLGDLAAGGPQPREVLARLRGLGCQAVRGNADGWLLEGLPPGRSNETRRLGVVVAWARATLAPDDLDYLAGLPPTLTITVDDLSLLCFHGSPRSDVEPLLTTTPEHELDEALAAAPQTSLFVCGHTHLQLLRSRPDRVLVNPGSVGLPLGSLTATEPPLPSWADYAIVELDGGDIELAFRRVAVDVEGLEAATDLKLGRRPRAAHRAVERTRVSHRGSSPGARFIRCLGCPRVPGTAESTRPHPLLV
jgi:putative phosphoesterase